MTPEIEAYFGLTGMMGPEKPAARRLSAITRPTEAGLGLAPISATEAGLKMASRLRIDIGTTSR